MLCSMVCSRSAGLAGNWMESHVGVNERMEKGFPSGLFFYSFIPLHPTFSSATFLSFSCLLYLVSSSKTLISDPYLAQIQASRTRIWSLSMSRSTVHFQRTSQVIYSLNLKRTNSSQLSRYHSGTCGPNVAALSRKVAR